MTITDGPMAGFQALVLVPSSSFRFLDLPTEIRYIIYELLIPPGRTHLSLSRLNPLRRCNVSSKTPRVVPIGYGSKEWMAEREWDDEARKYINGSQRTPLSLLLVNRQTHAEAFPVLYQSHAFDFDSAATLFRFLKVNPAAVKVVTDVCLDMKFLFDQRSSDYAHSRSLERGLKLLARARPAALRTLRLYHVDIMRSYDSWGDSAAVLDAETLVHECTAVLNAIYRSRRQKGVAIGIDTVLKIDHDYCLDHGACSGCQKMDDHVKKLVRDSFLMDLE